MKFEDFISGTYTKQNTYKAFLPSLINHSWEWENTRLNTLLEDASREIGSLNSFAELIPNVDVYIKMHIHAEANKSSKIEGTKTSIEDELLSIEDVIPEKRDDYEEVHNYIDALNHGITRITQDNFPLSSRLICELHEILLQGVRGKRKTPGEFRKSQNWIGGTMPSNAIYVPPFVGDLHTLLYDFENFIHNDGTTPHLIKIAILHYQFESIHPFLDGNGRIGRLLIQLYLLDKKVLDKPCFYISDFLESHRDAYYDALHRVRTNNDIIHWTAFFLEAVIYTAQSAKMKFKKVVQLIEQYRKDVIGFSGKTANNLAILESFFESPYQQGREIQAKTNLSQPTVDKSIQQLLQSGIITETTGNTRNRIFALHQYIAIFAGMDDKP